MVADPASLLAGLGSIGRAIDQHASRACPNVIPDAGTLLEAKRHGMDEATYRRAMKSLGYGDSAIDAIEKAAESITSPNDLVTLREKGLISDEEFKAGLKANGFSDEAANNFLAAKESPPTPAQALEMKRKGSISEDELRKTLKANGMSDDAIDAFIETSDFHFSPSEQAQIDKRARMGDETLQALGLDTNPSADFVATCRRQGMTDGQIQDAWLNQQTMPSANEIVDLLHKGALSDQTAREALKGLGMTDSQVALALKSQQSTIPARTAGTMFMNEGMSSDELYNNLVDNGYSPEDARKITDYYQKQKDEADAKAAAAALKKATAAKASSSKGTSSTAKAAKDKDVSLGLIKQAYYYKEATYDDATGLIESLDYEPWEAALTLAIWDAQLAAKDQQDEVDYLTLAFQKGFIDEAELRHQLGSMGIKGVVIDTIILKNTKIISLNSKKPSEAKLGSWLKKGIIDLTAYIDGMTTLGYDIDTIALYYEELGGIVE